MTANFWLTVGQTVVFLAVCGYGWWAARLIAEAADSSAQAAEQALKAANDAKRTATDIREMRDMLKAWLDQQQAQVSHLRERQAQAGAVSIRRVSTDTAEAQAVITPQAIVSRSTSMDLAERPPEDPARSHRGRHAVDTATPWAAALRAAASRTTSRTKS